MIISVLVELSNRNIDKTFNYLVPAHLENKIKIGGRVLVPFSTYKLEGFVLEILDNYEKEFLLKEVIDVVDSEIILTKELLELGKYISESTLSTLISSYQVMLPTGYKASKNKEVAQMIYNLASMFRYSTYNNGSLVTIRDEINHSKMYLSLCSTRYKGMLDYSIYVDDKYLDYLVPKFTIQPILENSINHGLRKGSYDNHIKISISNINEYIEINVEDNGNGMSEDAINKIKEGLKKNIQKPNSIGLMNINNRFRYIKTSDSNCFI